MSNIDDSTYKAYIYLSNSDFAIPLIVNGRDEFDYFDDACDLVVNAVNHIDGENGWCVTQTLGKTEYFCYGVGFPWTDIKELKKHLIDNKHRQENQKYNRFEIMDIE